MEIAGTISVPRSIARMSTVDSGGGVPSVRKQMKGEISDLSWEIRRAEGEATGATV